METTRQLVPHIQRSVENLVLDIRQHPCSPNLHLGEGIERRLSYKVWTRHDMKSCKLMRATFEIAVGELQSNNAEE